MAKTKIEVISQANRILGLLSVDEVPTADQYAFAETVLDGLYAELNAVHNTGFTWSLVDEVPDGIFLPLATLLAVEIAPHYDIPAGPRSAAIMRVRSFAFSDDRPDDRDYDDDGTVTDEEAAAAERALYY